MKCISYELIREWAIYMADLLCNPKSPAKPFATLPCTVPCQLHSTPAMHLPVLLRQVSSQVEQGSMPALLYDWLLIGF